MGRKKDHFSSKTKNRRPSPYKGKMVLFGLVGFIVFVFYLWGKVQINFALQQNDRLKKKERTLQLEADNLRSQVDAMRSYKRIVELAQEQGMVSLSPSRVAELQVDMKGIEFPNNSKYKLRYAGFASLKRSGREK